MALDDLFLALQRGIDRLVRRLRLGPPPPRAARPQLLVIQIDGLSRSVFEHARASGHMPFVAHLLARHGYRAEPMAVGIPTSTPAFQMAAMYGVPPDIPGFHYHDKRRRLDIHFPRAGHAALVEGDHTAGRTGILRGGSAYGCVFTGGAEHNIFSFARLTRPTGAGVLRAMSAFVVLGWVFTKSLARTVVELLRSLLRLVANPFSPSRRGWQWLTIRIGISVWVRALFTLSASRDLYAGVPTVYVNYLDYDVAAHAFGPRSRRALRSLRRVDRSIHQLWRVLRRVPEHAYDLYILSDHGQAHCTPYASLSGGRRLERWLLDELIDPRYPGEPEGAQASDLRSEIRAYRAAEKGIFQRFVNYLEEGLLGDREAYERGAVRVISAGPNAFLYVVDTAEPLELDQLEARFPGLAEQISRGPGIGYVLARSASGPVCFFRGKRYLLGGGEFGPFASRDDAALVVQGIADLMAMRSAGDLVIYGIGAPEGDVSFIPETGAHAGPSHDELHTFIVRPGHVSLPSPIGHPIQLYEHFIRYQECA